MLRGVLRLLGLELLVRGFAAAFLGFALAFARLVGVSSRAVGSRMEEEAACGRARSDAEISVLRPAVVLQCVKMLLVL